jgi:3'-phosphoadenosine 5'-phosphosulfate sulfotransferase (PAPS reductase)/FAD synthetase
MLKQFLDANPSRENMVVCYANTGKEEEKTLEFVDRCSREWDVPIVWIEYDIENRFRLVDFESASRHGEPFEILINKKGYLPNPVTRFCTVELKIRPMHWYLKSIGWKEYNMATGIRADEPRRVAKIRARGSSSESSTANMILPLDDAGVTVRDVSEFWQASSFDLELPTINGKTMHGNCDLCFLKGGNQIASLIAEKPERADWWAKMESLALASKPSGAVFRSDRPSYRQMMDYAKDQMPLFSDESIECFCGD